jgi:hypothetical protein
MTNPYATFREHPLRAIFAPVVWGRTYARILYLIIGFPLGLLYFVLYVTGFALGLGLLVLGIGVAILAALILLARPLGRLERVLAIHLLGEDVPPVRIEPLPDREFSTWLKDVYTSAVTWKSLFFLLIKFPLGLASWIVVVVGLSVSLSITAAPVVVAFGGDVEFGFWEPATVGEALILVPIGLVLVLLAIHLFNAIAWTWSKLARFMLGSRAISSPSRPAEAIHLAPAPI